MTQPNSSEPSRTVKNHANYDDIRSLAIPSQVVVTSQSNFKLGAVRNVLGDVWPDRDFDVQGVKVPSGVSEQPLGQETVQGALNRLNAAKIECRQRGVHMANMAFFSIENGLFRGNDDNPAIDLTTIYDSNASYYDRAVVVVDISGIPARAISISPDEEAVRFPPEIVHETFARPGGFATTTVGSVLLERKLVENGQDPHSSLTNGELPRQTQINHALLRALQNLANNSRIA